jgi:ATP-dependent helicase/DNAse subunit B
MIAAPSEAQEVREIAREILRFALSGQVLSPTRLETYASCPFKHFSMKFSDSFQNAKLLQNSPIVYRKTES